MAADDPGSAVGRVPYIPDFGGMLAELGWMKNAQCAGMESLFFSRDEDDRAAAMGICRRCPVLSECQDWSRQVQPRGGVWAGKGAGYWQGQRRPERRAHRADATTQVGNQ